MNISDAIEEYLAAKQNSITHDTYSWYATYLDQFSVWCKTKPLTTLSQITPGHVQQFASAAKTMNTYTQHARVQIVKGFLAWCAQVDEMEVKEKTIKRIELPKVEQAEIALFSDQEIFRLFRACDQMRDPHRYRALVHLCTCYWIQVFEQVNSVMMQLVQRKRQVSDSRTSHLTEVQNHTFGSWVKAENPGQRVFFTTEQLVPRLSG